MKTIFSIVALMILSVVLVAAPPTGTMQPQAMSISIGPVPPPNPWDDLCPPRHTCVAPAPVVQ